MTQQLKGRFGNRYSTDSKFGENFLCRQCDTYSGSSNKTEYCHGHRTDPSCCSCHDYLMAKPDTVVELKSD